MSRETDNIDKLFSSKLSNFEMDVEGDFWNSLNNDVMVARGRRKAMFYRIASCAAVLALLITTSAAIWMFSPKEEEMKNTFTQIERQANAPVPFGDFALSSDKPDNSNEKLSQAKGGRTVQSVVQEIDENDNDSVYISFSFSIRTSSNQNAPRNNHMADNLWRAGLNNSSTTDTTTDDNHKQQSKPKNNSSLSAWSSKIFIGSALPDGSNFKAPVEAGVSVERRINKTLGIEAGLTYSMLRSGNVKQHDLAIPVKLNAKIVESKKTDFYATLGGMVEKCIAADNNADKKVRAGVTAGLGMNYKVNDRLALFAEPTVTHHFISKNNTNNIRSQRPTNLNLTAGLRITY